jgi:hypothetical protein
MPSATTKTPPGSLPLTIEHAPTLRDRLADGKNASAKPAGDHRFNKVL